MHQCCCTGGTGCNLCNPKDWRPLQASPSMFGKWECHIYDPDWRATRKRIQKTLDEYEYFDIQKCDGKQEQIILPKELFEI